MSIDYKAEIKRLKEELDVTVVAHYYQRDEVFEMADITGDSLELARRCKADKNPWVVFAGVGFMGQSVKVIAPEKRVLMPKIACCAMARMIDGSYFDESVEYMVKHGIAKENILPITYINSDASVKAKVGEMGGMVCTSSNAYKIIEKGLESGKKILFVPDRCLGQNFANSMGLKSCVIGVGECDTYVLSSTKPECPTMNETTLKDLYLTLKSIEDGNPINEIVVDPHTVKYANLALERMLAIK
ncbi:MAG: quinolinate synthase NadA [Campylobacterales bacterium]|nr:quinolinate synthase NadA [Campylobacterales bacterium]